jgi:uncharacterized protein YyaL (SSP411 family)
VAEQLRGERSAFLRTFADSPVDWMKWGEPAFDRARRERKPVFVFMGQFTSELARAMRLQTFANLKTAQWLNQQFVCVVVDREERPDLAALYQAYIEDVRQLNGWPLNLWLTPELVPYDGAAYLSPSEEWGQPGFLKQAKQAIDAWVGDPAGCRRRAAEAIAQLKAPAQSTSNPWTAERSALRLSAGADAWRDNFDPSHGGFSEPPKTPEPELARFLLRRTPADRDAALKTLRALAESAVRDPLDGGFFRYASDVAWHLPYPQKALSDQARVALAFLDAAEGADTRSFEQCARGALDFALGRLGRRDGTFASALDATGPTYAGYYAWSEAEIDRALGGDSAAFKRAHGVESGGNVPPTDDPSGLYASKNLLRACAVTDAKLAADAARLLALRDQRPAPLRDERATTGSQGLMLAALARAAEQLHDSRYLAAAKKTLGALKRAHPKASEGGLGRLEGSPEPAAAIDYAGLALGCRLYAHASGDKAAGTLADRLLARLDANYFDPIARRYFGAPRALGPGLFTRPLAWAEPEAPESLTLLAGPSPDRARALAGGLLDSLEEASAQAPGDQLLALALYADRPGGN